MAVSEMVHGWLNEIRCVNEFDELRFRKIGQLSGSTVFGGKKETETDIDVIMTMKQLKAIAGMDDVYQWGCLCYGTDHYDEHSFNSFYAKNADGLVFNVLAFHEEHDADAWKFATNCLLTTIKGDELFAGKLESKDFRVASFQKFKDSFYEGVNK